MTCVSYGNVIVVCRPDGRFLRRHYLRCPTDECITEQVVRYEEWYAPTIWCCRCGDSWDAEEGLRPRPFRRNWRRDAVRKARALWDRATYGPPPTLADFDPSYAEGVSR